MSEEPENPGYRRRWLHAFRSLSKWVFREVTEESVFTGKIFFLISFHDQTSCILMSTSSDAVTDSTQNMGDNQEVEGLSRLFTPSKKRKPRNSHNAAADCQPQSDPQSETGTSAGHCENMNQLQADNQSVSSVMAASTHAVDDSLNPHLRFKAGDLILTSDPIVHLLVPGCKGTHCDNCHKLM